MQQWVDGDIRRRFGLSAQMACNAPRKVGAAYHTLWAKVKQNTEHRKKGFTKKCYKGLDQPPVFTAGTTTISYNRDYRWKSGQRVSITTVDGPRVFAYERYAKHVAMIGAGNRSGVTFGAAKLWRDPRT